MSDVKYVFIATGQNTESAGPAFFTVLAAASVMNQVRVLSKNKHRTDSRITVPSTVSFVHFNFEKNTVQYYTHAFATTGKDPFSKQIMKNPQSMFSDANPVGFIRKSPTMSITDVYHSVRAAPDHSVLDVHLFSHGFLEGPVLMDTNDTLEGTDGDHFPDGSPKRDPADLDGRKRTDFAPNMGEDPTKPGEGQASSGGGTALAEFLRGFALQATFRAYGCNIQDKVIVPDANPTTQLVRSTPFLVLHEVFDKPIQNRTSTLGQALRASASARPTDVPIDMDRECDNETKLKDPHDPTQPLTTLTKTQLIAAHSSTDSTFFNGDTTGHITRNYNDIIEYIARQAIDTYIFVAADALPGVTCYGAVPGTSGEREEPVGGDRTMIVKGFGRYLMFYRRYVEIDTVDPGTLRPLHYGRFDTATVAKIKAHAATG